MYSPKCTKADAIAIVTSAARIYEANLRERNFLVIYKERSTNSFQSFESVFLARNYLHLTGLEYLNKNENEASLEFYQKCLNSKLTETEIQFHTDGTTVLKLQALPKIVHFTKTSKMTGVYNNSRPLLEVCRLTGTTNCCLGFKHDACGFYVPSSVLLEDIRDFTFEASQILAILSKSTSAASMDYKELCYSAKGFSLKNLYKSFPFLKSGIT